MPKVKAASNRAVYNTWRGGAPWELEALSALTSGTKRRNHAKQEKAAP